MEILPQRAFSNLANEIFPSSNSYSFFFHECGTLMLFSFHFASQVVGLFAVNVNMIVFVCVCGCESLTYPLDKLTTKQNK